MSKYQIVHLFLAFLIVLSGCSPNNPQQTDWCYRYDFTTSSYSANIINGEWVEGEGFTQNASGFLNFNYSTAYTVQAAQVIVKVSRPDEVGDVDIEASADVFGVDVHIDELWADAYPDELELPFSQTDPSEIGSAVNVSLKTTHNIYLESLEVRGFGVNPFPLNLCDNNPTPPPATSTLSADTPVPSNTPTAVTNTPTITYTPSPTYTPTTCTTWTYTFDFSLSDYPGLVTYAGGQTNGVGATWDGTQMVWVDSTGNAGGAWFRGVQFNMTTQYTSTVTAVEVVYSITKGTVGAGTSPSRTWAWFGANGNGSSTQTYNQTSNGSFQTWNVSIGSGWNVSPGGGIYLRIDSDIAGTAGGRTGSAYIHSVTLHGTGPNAFTGVTGCPSPTPSQSPTPSDTPTPSPTVSPTASRTLIPRTPTAGPSPTRTPIVFPTTTPVAAWCTVFDFRSSDQGWDIHYGSRDTGGLKSADAGSDFLEIEAPPMFSTSFATRMEIRFNTTFSGLHPRIRIAQDDLYSQLWTPDSTSPVTSIYAANLFYADDIFVNIDRNYLDNPPQYFESLRVMSIRLQGIGPAPFIQNCVAPTPGPSETPFPTSTATSPPASATFVPTGTYVPAPTYVPTQLPNPGEEGGGSGGGDGWGTCGDDITINGLGAITDWISQFWHCTVGGFFAGIINSIGAFFSWIGNSATNFGNFLGSIFGWLNGTFTNIGLVLGNIWQVVVALFDLVRLILEQIVEIIRLVFAIIRRFIELILGWLGQLIQRAEQLLTAWFLSPPTPIPNLPLCVSNPTSYAICAVYYVLQNTILAGGVGGLFVPVLVIIFDLVMVLYFVRTVRNLIRKSGSVSQ